MRGWERAHTNSQEQTTAGHGGRWSRWHSRLALGVALGLMGALFSAAVPGAAQAASPTWSAVTTPNQPGPEYGELSSVSCVSASSCVAVGTSSPNLGVTLAETWNGSTWKIVPSPDKGTVGSALTGVSCVSATDCQAVGYFYTGPTDSPTTNPLAESWNGKTWSIASTPTTAADVVQAVSCVSASSCTAVGGNPEGTVTESWNGSKWAVVPSPDTGTGDTLQGVSCPAAGSCVAVGHYVTGTGINATLVESWNGSTWSIVSSPNSGVAGSTLSGVSCISAKSCTAVGSNANGQTTLIESWNGSTWSVVSSPNQDDNASQLAAVSCVSASSCSAVGTYQSQNPSDDALILQTLAESWNGSTWSIVSSPNPVSEQTNELTSVSCRAASACTAVGSDDYQGEFTQTLVGSWNGSTWSVVSSPNDVSYFDELSDVSCVSASFCVAVGYYRDGAGVDRTLIESWNGTAWSIVPSPNEFSNNNVLDSVSCTSTSFCVAVGSWANDTATLVESWNGSTWSVVPSPKAPASPELLTGVSCVSASFCVAAGYYYTSTLVESWNGSTWSIVSSPNVARNRLFGVSCASASFCVATGFYVVPSEQEPEQTLVESWNGSTWSMVSSPDQNANNNVLNGVSCVSASSCAAVGYAAKKGTLAESWNGTAWLLASSPEEGTGTNTLNGVACVSASSCVAVGYAAGDGALVESWNGTAWSLVSSPGAESDHLAGVSCLSATSCTAAGYYSGPTVGGVVHQYSLIERSS
jgi:hypothetical protein